VSSADDTTKKLLISNTWSHGYEIMTEITTSHSIVQVHLEVVEEVSLVADLDIVCEIASLPRREQRTVTNRNQSKDPWQPILRLLLLATFLSIPIPPQFE
jgi:hypothetical protein